MAIAKKKKKFFDVEIPLIKKTTQLQSFELKELDGKFITYDLTRMMKGKNILLSAVVKADDEKATAQPRAIKLMRNSIKNVVRKGTDYIEDSFEVECNNATVTIKPILVSRRRISRVVKKALRAKAKEEITKYVADKNAEDLIAELLRNQLQKPLSLTLKKVYPLSLCEIRIFKIEKSFEPKKKIASPASTSANGEDASSDKSESEGKEKKTTKKKVDDKKE